jgi:predicted PurR-regulated permease PerM
MTTASSSVAVKMARKFSMAAFLVAVCVDLFSWRRKKRRDSRVLVYLSSFSLMLMTFLMFISFDSYSSCAIPIVPLIIGAGLVHHKLRFGRQPQNNNDDEFDKLQSDIFDFSALILNGAGFITAFATATMHSFSSVPNEHTKFSF